MASSAALAAGALTAPGLALAQGPSGPPVGPVRPVTEVLWGGSVTDPSRLMEAEGPEWKSYGLAEGAYASRVLGAIPGRDGLLAKVQTYTRVVASVMSAQVGGDYIFSEVRPAGADTYKLYARKA